MSSYDVIVIGSGAGGGTLVQHLAPSGKRILLLERGDWLPREPAELERRRRVRRQPVHLARTPGSTRTGQGLPAAGPLLRRGRHQALRRGALPPARRRTSGSCATTTASRPRGPSPTTRWSRTTPRPSSSTRCTASVARIRRSRPPSAPYPFPAVSHEPRIQQLSDDLAAAGLPARSTPRAGSCSTRRTCRYSACVRCADLRRLPLSRPREVRCRGARRAAGPRAPERHAADERAGRRASHQLVRHAR